ncbi:small membrane protein [Klebsiella aerogenes]
MTTTLSLILIILLFFVAVYSFVGYLKDKERKAFPSSRK